MMENSIPPLPNPLLPREAREERGSIIWQQLQQNKLPHALLLVGAEKAFTEKVVATLLCKETCGHCQSCLLLKSGTHPDRLWVEAELNHAIKIDQIREITEFVQQTALMGGNRVIVINPAHSLNMYAANALLKTLEEPESGIYFMLMTDQPGRLPATIRSRCQKIIFPNLQKPTENIFLEELSKKGLDPVELAERWQEHPPELILESMFLWVKDRLWKAEKKEGLLQFLDHLQKVNRMVREGHNLNQRLFLEELFIKWVQYAAH